MQRTLLVALDGGHCARRALVAVADLAKQVGARVLAVFVVDDSEALLDVAYIDRDDLLRRMATYGQCVLDDASKYLQREGVSHETKLILQPTRKGSVAETLLKAADAAAADLIAMGTHGRRGLRRLIMGSVSHELVLQAQVPVLLVRSDGE